MFVAKEINKLWVANMTYLPTWEGFLCLTVVTNACSRKVMGWAFGVQMTAYLVISALNMALHTRRPESVIHHSDKKPGPKKMPTLNEVIRLIAQRGGFLGRKGDDEPGAKTLWLGLQEIAIFVKGARYAREFSKAGTCV